MFVSTKHTRCGGILLRCPYCSHDQTRVIDKRKTQDLSSNRRRRICLNCGRRFTTFEKVQKGSNIINIEKRDGRLVPFQQEKITRVLKKAMKSSGQGDEVLAEKLSEEVIDELENKFDGKSPTVEQIQDIVEKILLKEEYYITAKSFILYRQKRSEVRSSKALMENIKKTVDSYVKKSAWKVKENANLNYSFNGLRAHISGKIMGDYVLNNVYPKEISKAHRAGDFHLHDSETGTFCGYCAGWSLSQLLREGFGGISGKVSGKPAAHLSPALAQIVTFFGTLQNEWAGAQAFSSLDTYMAPFIYYDKLDYKAVKQAVQMFVFGINQTSRWGAQSPFTNVSLDWKVPEDLKDLPVIYKGKLQKETYADFQEEMDLFNKAFCEIMLEGDADGRTFTFPIPTYNITKDFDWNDENTDLLFKMTAKYGTPYFQNFVNSSLKPTDVRSMCCRLQLNLKDLRAKTGGLFGSGERTGSIGVVTINLPKIGYTARTEQEYFDKLEHLMHLAKSSLEIKRKEVEKNMAQGLLPFTKRYLGHLNTHFSTIGLLGMNESCENFLNEGIATPTGRKFALKVLNFMRDRLIEIQEETNHIYNLEATPAEGAAYRLARLDRKTYPKIHTAGTQQTPYYTNSSQLPVGATDDLFEALEHQDELQTKYTGGTVFHAFLGERLDSLDTTKKLVKRISHGFKLPYFTLSPTFSVCPEHGYINGEHRTCPHESNNSNQTSVCGAPCEVFSRVVGFYRPVSDWNDGKQQEFSERKVYNVIKSLQHN